MNNSKSHNNYLLSNHPGLVACAFTSTPREAEAGGPQSKGTLGDLRGKEYHFK